ncbi:acyl carrier protein [Labrys neptuniae]
MKDVVFDGVSEIIKELFDEYDGPVTKDLNADAVEQWDSLANVQLMVMVEQTFKVRFTPEEIHGLRNVGDLVALVEQRMPA